MTQYFQLEKGNVPDYIISILQVIENNDFTGYIVGGAVRDLLLGRVPIEYDLASNARPDELNDLFENTTNIGAKFGTVCIHVGGHTVEVTTFRTEGTYLDYRHPCEVSFSSSIHEDVSRRDFTMNAMAYNPLSNEFVDHFDGVSHLKERRLVCVGQPEDRFREDTLRPFRCFRFMSQFGFVVSSDIVMALRQLSSEVSMPSMSRIRHEMGRLLLGEYWLSSLKVMHESGWLKRLISEYPEIKGVDLPKDVLFRWAWLLSKSSLPDTALMLQFSKADIRWMMQIIEWDFDEVAVHLTVNDLMVSSKDLMNLGYEGRALGVIQQELLLLVQKKEVVNTRDALLLYLSKKN